MTNRLGKEKSPYLLQHAENPVDWFPWGEEAFSKSLQEDKPIFLSIGYATCHWCHVMEKESFENPEIAQSMNENFINVKVDREEHPEVDGIYMEFAQALMSSAGGWPLNLVLTPELKPFFAVTYLPPKTGKGLIGMDEFITQVGTLWKSEERQMLVNQADAIVQLFQNIEKQIDTDLPTEDDLENAVQVLFDIADPLYGGVKGEPKFPMSYQADFLLQYAKSRDDSRALFYTQLTLEMMAKGGLYDQLGGGFSRYCVDQRWHIPHFEKMLYDNAMLAKTYLNAYKYNKTPLFERICKETLNYSLRELKGEGFFSAEDADSEGKEGEFYLWTQEEIYNALGEEEGEIFCKYYGVTAGGNFNGKNILRIALDDPSLLSGSESGLEERLKGMRSQLFELRNKRSRPFKDDKVISSWNGLMIDALGRAGLCFEESSYLKVAAQTADWIKERLWNEEEGLKRRFRDGESRFAAGLDDYAFLIQGLLTLFETGMSSTYLSFAIELTNQVNRLFSSPQGGFYKTRKDVCLLLRKRDFYDGAEPSGNAVHCENLLRLNQITQKQEFLEGAEGILKGTKPFIEAFPPGACYHLIALQRYLDQDAPLVVIALDKERTHEKEIRKAIGELFSPHAAFIWKGFGEEEIDRLLPHLKGQGCEGKKTTVHICHSTRCVKSLTDLEPILEEFSSW